MAARGPYLRSSASFPPFALLTRANCRLQTGLDLVFATLGLASMLPKHVAMSHAICNSSEVDPYPYPPPLGQRPLLSGYPCSVLLHASAFPRVGSIIASIDGVEVRDDSKLISCGPCKPLAASRGHRLFNDLYRVQSMPSSPFAAAAQRDERVDTFKPAGGTGEPLLLVGEVWQS